MSAATVPTPDQLAEKIEQGDLRTVAEALHADSSLVSAVTDDGDTALHLACWHKQIAIIATILAHKPDLNARGLYGRTALHYAVHEGRYISVPIVAVLLAVGADPNIRDGNGFSVEDWAKIEMSDGLAEVLDLLRRAQAT